MYMISHWMVPLKVVIFQVDWKSMMTATPCKPVFFSSPGL